MAVLYICFLLFINIGLSNGCSKVTPFDLFFILDTSASVKTSSGRWTDMKVFTDDVVTKLHISVNDIRVGVIRFGSYADTSINLSDTYTSAAVTGLTVIGGATDTHEALQEMISKFNAEPNHRSDDPNLVVVITDGESGDGVTTKNLADSARVKGIRLFVIAIELTRPAQLRDIANDPDDFFINMVATSGELSGLVDNLVTRLCAVAEAARGSTALGDSCSQDSDCINITHSACTSGTCQCITTYMYDASILGCRIRNVGESCSNDIDCSNYTHGTCNSGVCGCPSGFATVSSVNLCQNCTLRIPCDSRADCSSVIPHSHCDSNVTCDTTWLEGDPKTCIQRQLTVHPCDTDSDCDIAHSYCNASKTCICGTSYKESTDLRSCQPITIGDNCVTSQDCSNINPPGSCSNSDSKCACVAGYKDKIGSLYCITRQIGEPCTADSDCSAIEGAFCKNGTCACGTGYLTTSSGISCRPLTLLVDICANDPECFLGVPNSFCLISKCDNNSCVGLCICKSGYRIDQSQNTCDVVFVGISTCVSDSDCLVGVKNSECSAGVCQCVDGYHREGNRLNCTKLVLENPCNVGENCSTVVDNSECRNGVCSCVYGWIKKDTEKCKRVVLGEGPCSTDTDCDDVISNSTCTHGKCKCKDGFSQANTTYCKYTRVGDTTDTNGPNVGLIVGLVVGALVLVAAGVGGGLFVKLKLLAGKVVNYYSPQNTDRLLKAVEEFYPEGAPGAGSGEVIGRAPASTHPE